MVCLVVWLVGAQVSAGLTSWLPFRLNHDIQRSRTGADKGNPTV